MDWSVHFPEFSDTAPTESEAGGDGESSGVAKTLLKHVEIADIGCGFGGLLFALAPKMPETLILGTPRGQLLTTNSTLTLHLLIRRTRNPGLRHRVCPKQNPCSPSTTLNHHPHHHRTSHLLPSKHLRPPRQHHEIPPQPLPQIPTLQNLPLLPRPAL